MNIDYIDWLNLLLRWAHIVVGIGWIGASFYFVALDYALRNPSKNSQLNGEAWQVHGGGFYHVQKYKVAPENLPDKLIWYKWDAYLTWVTGFLLLVVQYYVNADLYLIDPTKMELTKTQAVAFSIVSLAMGWLLYDLICRLTRPAGLVWTTLLVFILILAATHLYSNIFSGRGTLIHVGAFIGTIMAVNVFGVIIPNQKKIVASLMKGDEPDAKLGVIGKQRSLHNNYLTLPVLLMMVSNHYPILSSHEQTWLIVALVILMGACVRHLINRHEAGDELGQFIWALPFAVVSLAAIVVITAPRPATAVANASMDGAVVAVSDSQVLEIVSTHCGACHAPIEGEEEYFVAPKDVRLADTDDLVKFRAVVVQQAVQTNAMPMGNATGMTPEERQLLGQWIDENAPR